MSKKTLAVIAASAIGLSIASIAWAAVNIKYFQKIKQTNYSGSAVVTVTKGAESQIQTGNDAWEQTWKPGDAVPSTSSTNGCVALRGEHGYVASACQAGYANLKTNATYTTKITGLPAISTDTDPPTFYLKTKYYLNGKIKSLPIAESKEYAVNGVIRTIFDDGTYSDTAQTLGAPPKVGSTTYTYKTVTLQPSN